MYSLYISDRRGKPPPAAPVRDAGNMAATTVGPATPVSDKYAFQATSKRTNGRTAQLLVLCASILTVIRRFINHLLTYLLTYSLIHSLTY